MTTYLIGHWTNTNFSKILIPLGIVARENDSVETRVIDQKMIPEDYKPRDPISKRVFENPGLEEIFRGETQASNFATNLYFTEINPDNLVGTLAERADKLFSEKVLQYYSK